MWFRLTRRAISVLLLCAAMMSPARAQQYLISTYAGVPSGPSTSTALTSIGNMSVGTFTTDTLGNLYFAAGTYNFCVCIFKLDPKGVLTRVAGAPRANGSSG